MAGLVGSTSAEAIRAAGFEVVTDPSRKFPNHARIIHPDGSAGFSEENRQRLSAAFRNVVTPEGP
jgi:hypothetical protein